MAGFYTHVSTSAAVGIIYGGAAVDPLGFNADTGFLAAGLTALGGMLPDLDSDSGKPIRELSALAAATVPLLLAPRLTANGVQPEGVLTTIGFLYLIIRYLGAYLLKRLTVHRGMFHSIPAMLIAGLLIYLEYHGPLRTRLLLAGGIMVGFLSHLILDEVYSVDFNGVRINLKPSAGSALKFFSPSITACCVCYGILGGLGFLAYLDWQAHAAQFTAEMPTFSTVNEVMPSYLQPGSLQSDG